MHFILVTMIAAGGVRQFRLRRRKRLPTPVCEDTGNAEPGTHMYTQVLARAAGFITLVLPKTATSPETSDDKPGADKPSADKPSADKPFTHKPIADKPVADEPVAPPKGKGAGKGKGKAKDIPKPPMPGKAAGKGSEKKSPVTKSKPTPTPETKFEAEAPFGRRIHWVKPTYEEPDDNTIFGEMKSTDVTLDTQLLNAMFSAEIKTPPRDRKWSFPKPVGVSLLDTSRATNLAIMLKKLPATPDEFCRCALTIDNTHPTITAEHVELVANAMPNSYEANKLLSYKGEPGMLRYIEQVVMPFCSLSPVIVQVLMTAMTHRQTYLNLKRRCDVMCRAAQEIRRSCELRELLKLILQVGNYINFGDSSSKVHGFAIESLQCMASFKVGPISALHFLCISMRIRNSNFLLTLLKGVQHVSKAAHEKAHQLEADVDIFLRNFEAARARLQNLQTTPDWTRHRDIAQLHRERLGMLVAELDHECTCLRSELEAVRRSTADAGAYFSASSTIEGSQQHTTAPKRQLQADGLVSADVFFGHIAGFLAMFQSTWQQIEANPRKWRMFEVAAAAKSGKFSGAESWAHQLSRHQPTLCHSASHSGTEDASLSSSDVDSHYMDLLRQDSIQSVPEVTPEICSSPIHKSRISPIRSQTVTRSPSPAPSPSSNESLSTGSTLHGSTEAAQPSRASSSNVPTEAIRWSVSRQSPNRQLRALSRSEYREAKQQIRAPRALRSQSHGGIRRDVADFAVRPSGAHNFREFRGSHDPSSEDELTLR